MINSRVKKIKDYYSININNVELILNKLLLIISIFFIII